MGKVGGVVFSMLCLLSVAVFGAPGSKCPPGGTYFDKHLGQYGRWQCCSEICKALIFKDTCEKKCPNYHQDKAATEKPNHPKLPAAADSSSAEEDGSSQVAVISVVVAVAALLTIVAVTVFGLVKRGWFKGVSPVRPLDNQAARQPMRGARGGQEDDPEVVPMQEMPTEPQQHLLGDTNTPRDDVLTDNGAGRDNATEEAAGGYSGISGIAQSESSLSSRSQGYISGHQTAKETGISVQVEDHFDRGVAIHGLRYSIIDASGTQELSTVV